MHGKLKLLIGLILFYQVGYSQGEILFLKEGESVHSHSTNHAEDLHQSVGAGFRISPVDSGWALINDFGKRLTDRSYVLIGQFKAKRAACQFGERWGFLDEKGREIIPSIYHSVTDFNERSSTAFVYDGVHWFEIGTTGVVKRKMPGNYQPNPEAFNSFQSMSRSYSAARANPPAVNNLFPCPPNIGFETGTFANWITYAGRTSCAGAQNTTSVSPTPPQQPYHTIVASSGATDFYGGFPLAAPDGSNYFVRLGNTRNGAEAEAIRYSIQVPPGASNYSITYNYAVVFQDPSHTYCQQPRFIARIFDPRTNTFVTCSRFEFVSTSGLPGFSTSPRAGNVRFKPWASAYINLGVYAGQTVYLEFVTVDCTLGGHWGYAYLDVNNTCDLAAQGLFQCAAPNITTLTGPPGFQTYTWWNQNFTTTVGTGNPLILNPGPPLGTQFNLVMVPYNGFGCLDTVPVIISPQIPNASFTPPVEQCLRGNRFTFTSTSTTPVNSTLTNHEWDFGDNSPRVTGSTVSHSYATAGDFQVTLIVTNNATCRDTVSYTVRVKDSPVASFTAPAEQCLRGNQFQFVSNSSMTVGTISNVSWNFGNGNSTSGTPVTYSYPSSGAYNVRLIATASNGCTDTAFRPVQVNPQPQASFTTHADQCLGGNSFTFSSSSTISPGAIGATTWNFGDNTTGAGNPVTHSYATGGDYSVKLEVVSDKGCIDSTRRTISVFDDPIVNITAIRPLTFCQGDSVILQANAQAGSGIIIGYQWFNGGNAISGATGTQLVVKSSGSYSIRVINSNGCDSTSTAMVVTVHPLPVGNVQLPAADFICAGTPVLLTASGGATYQWFLNGNPIAGAVGNTYPALMPGLYEVELISTQGCRNRAQGSVRLKLFDKPVPDFSYPTSCAGRPIFFNNLSDTLASGDVTWNWSFGDGQTSTQYEPTHTYGYGLSYPVKLTATPLKCPNLADSITKTIRVENPRGPIRYPAVNALINVSKQLAARNFGVQYEWTPRTGLNDHLMRNPVFRYLLQTDYTIRIETAAGCITVDSQLVRVFKNIDIFVPKAFSPNGDGHNDRLDVFLVGIGQLKYFRVFNRWGQLLFETRDPAQLWDGTFQGVKQPLETYIWTAEGVGEDGTIVIRRGQTVLLR